MLGAIELGKGDFTNAKTHFSNAIRFDENFALALASLAEVQYLTIADDEDKFSENVLLIFKNVEHATQINPNQTMAYLVAGKTLLLIGDKKQAAAVLEKALEISDTDITLGKNEKEGIKGEINRVIKNI